MIEINLLPGATRKSGGSERGVQIGAALSSVTAQLTDKYLIGGGGALLVGLLAVGGMYLYQSRQESAITQRQEAAARDSARFSAVLTARSKAETTRDSVYTQLAIIKSIDDTRFTWPHLLEEVNLALPPYTWLTTVTQTSAVTTTAALDDSAAKAAASDTTKKKSNDPRVIARQKRAHADSLYNGDAATTRFRIVGQTVDIQALTLFMKNLEASPFIKDVQLTRSDLVNTENQQVTEFQLEAQSETPPTLGARDCSTRCRGTLRPIWLLAQT